MTLDLVTHLAHLDAVHLSQEWHQRLLSNDLHGCTQCLKRCFTYLRRCVIDSLWESCDSISCHGFNKHMESFTNIPYEINSPILLFNINSHVNSDLTYGKLCKL